MGSRDWAFEGFKASKPPLLSGFWRLQYLLIKELTLNLIRVPTTI